MALPARAERDPTGALRNDVGLYAEAAAEDGSFLASVPQAFSQPGVIHSAPMLDLHEHGGRPALQGTYADRSLRETEARRVPRIAGAE